jgi:hypothetical protein
MGQRFPGGENVSESPSGRSRHVELSLDQLVELQPGLGRLMPEIARRYWIAFYAARHGNWELAGHQLRQIVHLFHVGSTTRPKMARHLEAFRAGTLEPLLAAVEGRDWVDFENRYREGIASANRFHEATDHPEIRWRLPAEPPADLDLGPAGG